MTSFLEPSPLYNFSPLFFPTLPLLQLSDDEKAQITQLQQVSWLQRYWMELTDSYYRGMQVITNLGIAIPPQLSGLRTLVGWGRIPVDPMVERLAVDGFRLKGGTDVDDDLDQIWDDNSMDAEQKLAFIDALSMGRAWFTVGAPDEPGDSPKICVESPLNIAALWDTRTLKPKLALQTYWLDDRWNAALYNPQGTVFMRQDDKWQWEVVNREPHDLGVVPLVRMANEPSSRNRDGSSEITPEMMAIIDQACRTLQGLEVSREFYSVPQKIILGATEADFQSADGTQKSAFQTYISSVLALERDEDGNLPEIKQFTPYDPSVYTKLIDMLAAQFAGMTASPPQDLGLYTSGNPVSAESMQVSEGRRDRRAVHKQNTFDCSLIETMQLAMRFLNNGSLPTDYQRLEVDWRDVQQPNFSGMADGVSKLTTDGVWVASSDVTLAKTGLTAVERARMQADRKVDAGASFLAELAHSDVAKDTRTDLAVATDLGKPDVAQIPANVSPPPNQ